MLHSPKLKEVGDLKNILTSEMKMQSLGFTLLVFGLVLKVQYFITGLPSLHFGMVIYILCYCMLEVCHLLFFFLFLKGFKFRHFL